MKAISAMFLAAALTLVTGHHATARRSQTIYNAVDPLPPTVQGLPHDRIEDLIVAAGSEHGWMFRRVGPGHLEATYSRKRHVAVVDISFDQTNWRITYRTSEGLGAEGDEIHPTYNRWVRRLETNINRRLGTTIR